MVRQGKTARMLEYAIGAARQGREIAIIANSQDHRHKLHKQLLEEARNAGCEWVVGNGINGGNAGNIEVYHVAHALVAESTPGDYYLRGCRNREVLADNFVYEDRYWAVLKNYIRWT